MTEVKPIFRDLNADDPEPEATEIESLCMNCQENGITRLLLTRIPFYKEVLIMSFNCDKCGYQNNEIQSGASICDKGIILTLEVKLPEDLNRQVIKSDYTCVKIIDLDFEIPPKSQKGEVTTVEGIIDKSIRNLGKDQPLRKIQHPEDAKKLDDFIDQLKNLKDLKKPFTLVLEDISGNSFIENPNAPQVDPNCKSQHFKRTKDQNHELGIYSKNEICNESGNINLLSDGEFTLEDLQGEIIKFNTNCSNCGSPCETNMKTTNIPHFKEVVIMATNCEACGHRSNEVKSGGGIEPKGIHIEVKINSLDDFSRDVLKSETCDLKIPELELEVGPYALGGRFTTVEGLLVTIKDQLSDPRYSYMFGDSQKEEYKKKFNEFLEKIDQVLQGNRKITLILDDPAGNTYIQCLKDNDELDEGLTITHFERSFEQNEELGLNDIKTDNY